MKARRLIACAMVLVGTVLIARSTLLVERLTVWREIESVWGHNPPVSTAPFWRFKDVAVTYVSDHRLVQTIDRILGSRFDARSVREYQALPLLDYLARRGSEIGSGSFLTITNIRGERLYLTRAEIERERPVIVIGLDGEQELFRLYQRYRTKRENTWESPRGAMPWMVRPLGAFLYYPDDPPTRLELTWFFQYGLLPASFALSETDPLSAVRDVPGAVGEALFGSTHGCLGCHAFRGVGARSHHTRGTTGEATGGYAMPLESYDRAVMHEFLFNQESSATAIGVTPLRLDRTTATGLFDVIEGHR